MHTLDPVKVTEREIFMDVLRGFAILGIFIANLNSFSWYDSTLPDNSIYLLPEAVFIGQVIISTIWLKYFNYGPVEWLWRSATYKKWQPFRKNSNNIISTKT